MIQPATKYTPARSAAPASPMQIIVPGRKPPTVEEWLHRGLKPDGFLDKILKRERRENKKRLEYLSRKYRNFRQKKKSEHKLELVLPANTFFRILRMDPHFFDDDQSVKALKRDTPGCAPWEHS